VVHALKHEATDENPERWANATTLAWTMGRVIDCRCIAARGDAVCRLHEITSVEEHGCYHEAQSFRYALSSAEKHCKCYDDTIKTGGCIHIEEAKWGASEPCNLVRHVLECECTDGMASQSGSPLGVVKLLSCFGFSDHSPSNDEALAPIEVRFK
jgi:hypothetical protein